MSNDLSKYQNLTFEDFQRMANDASLSQCERIGFPDSYRSGKDEAILADISRKADNLIQSEKTILDIGIGCGGLASLIVKFCREKRHRLIAIDSKEVLQHLPDGPDLEKVRGRFPADCESLLSDYHETIDVILCYSVFHYVFRESNPFEFLDRTLTLLAPGGQMLIGDIPNVSKRKRFFSSAAGVRFHQEFMQTADSPDVRFNCLEMGGIDDSVVIAMVQRCRACGFDAYVLPESADLPMANRREDILVTRP